MKKMSMCFLPVVSDNGSMVGKRSKSSSSDVKSPLSPAKNMMGSDDRDDDAPGNSFGRKNKLGRRSLSRFVNAVFFETSLMKRMTSKKLDQKLHRIYNGEISKSKSELKPKKIFSPTINDVSPCEGIDHSTSDNSSKISSCLSKDSSSSSSRLLSLTTASDRSSSSSSRSSLTTPSGRSSSSSLSRNSRPASSKTAENNKMIEKDHGSRIVSCCLLLVSLLVLVIWGKVSAIFCTSAVLALTNRWAKRGPSDSVAVDPRVFEIDSKHYRKKIIMEGLLERNHGRNVYPYIHSHTFGTI